MSLSRRAIEERAKRVPWEEKMAALRVGTEHGSLRRFSQPVSMYSITYELCGILSLVMGRGWTKKEVMHLAMVCLTDIVNADLRSKDFPEINIPDLDVPEHHTGTQKLCGEAWKRHAERNGCFERRPKKGSRGKKRKVGDGVDDVGSVGPLQIEGIPGAGSGSSGCRKRGRTPLKVRDPGSL